MRKRLAKKLANKQPLVKKKALQAVSQKQNKKKVVRKPATGCNLPHVGVGRPEFHAQLPGRPVVRNRAPGKRIRITDRAAA